MFFDVFIVIIQIFVIWCLYVSLLENNVLFGKLTERLVFNVNLFENYVVFTHVIGFGHLYAILKKIFIYCSL